MKMKPQKAIIQQALRYAYGLPYTITALACGVDRMEVWGNCQYPERRGEIAWDHRTRAEQIAAVEKALPLARKMSPKEFRKVRINKDCRRLSPGGYCITWGCRCQKYFSRDPCFEKQQKGGTK